MKNRKDKKADIAAAAAFALVLSAACLWGESGRGATVNGTAGEARTVATSTAAREASIPEKGQEPAATGPAISKEQEAVLKELAGYMKENKLEEGARLLRQEEQMFQTLFYETLEGRRYLYDGEALREDVEGEGIVFTKANTVYYGAFANGKPEGQCTAMQAVDLESPRYDYSSGLWKDGMMEGEGSAGYCYYEGSPLQEPIDIEKKGTFTKDFMDGEIVYASVNGEGQRSTWTFYVEQGVIQLDQRWNYLKDQGEYQLLAEENDAHAYVVGEEQIALPVWKNLLAWEQ